MINQIPTHCIETFVRKFKNYPSICFIEPPYRPENFINQSIKKYHKLWEVKKVNSEGNVTYIDLLLEYDATGILFYIKEETSIFILSGIDKSDIVNFTIHNLKKRN